MIKYIKIQNMSKNILQQTWWAFARRSWYVVVHRDLRHYSLGSTDLDFRIYILLSYVIMANNYLHVNIDKFTYPD